MADWQPFSMTEFGGGIKLSGVNFSVVKFVFDFMLLMDSRGPQLHASGFGFSKLCWKQKLWPFLGRKLPFFTHMDSYHRDGWLYHVKTVEYCEDISEMTNVILNFRKIA